MLHDGQDCVLFWPLPVLFPFSVRVLYQFDCAVQVSCYLACYVREVMTLDVYREMDGKQRSGPLRAD